MHYKPFMFVFFNTNPNFLYNLLKQQEKQKSENSSSFEPFEKFC